MLVNPGILRERTRPVMRVFMGGTGQTHPRNVGDICRLVPGKSIGAGKVNLQLESGTPEGQRHSGFGLLRSLTR